MTMRPIDADALKQECMYRDDILAVTERDIDNAPTIDAIPVEWLKACGKRGSLIWIIADILIERWQKEQGAIT